ncbi:MAG TPA: YkgJ family cysteine cluster protein [Methanolinea sp.]|nr:YkgJ family cysteine cluster protein [Methanolinea sp.]
MSFFCQQCGECCSVMGQVFSIREERGDFRFLFENLYTGEETEVEVSPPWRELFSTGKNPSGWLNPCPFLRYDPAGGKAVCTVHATRPATCRDYGCWRVLVLDPSGFRVARVMEKRYLHLAEPSLERDWEEFRDTIDHLPDDAWDSAVARFFRQRGYSVFR